METTEHLISRLAQERDAALSALEANRLAGAPHTLIAADRLVGAYGLPWWITLDSSLRRVAASCALRSHPIVGIKAMELTMADVTKLLARIDDVLPDRH